VQVSEGLYRIGGGVNLLATNPKQNLTNASTNFTLKSNGDGTQEQPQLPLQPFAVSNNHSLILNSVENFQIVPKCSAAFIFITENQVYRVYLLMKLVRI